jgi:rhodanese-related sulfurtransferase
MDVSISPVSLHQSLGDFPPPLIIDVRREAAYSAFDRMLAGSIRRDPDQVEGWAGDLEIGRAVTVYCVHGREVSQGVAAALARRGFVARFLVGGIDSWVDQGFPVQPKPELPPTIWVTRERPKVDRIACPWLIRRFIDSDARFLYVPVDQVLSVAAETGAVPYDIPDAELGHHGDQCSFDAIVARYRLEDPALARLSAIVRGADTGRPDLVPEAAGLLALSRGLSAVFDDDQRQLRHGLVLYDALFAWCRERDR